MTSTEAAPLLLGLPSSNQKKLLAKKSEPHRKWSIMGAAVVLAFLLTVGYMILTKGPSSGARAYYASDTVERSAATLPSKWSFDRDCDADETFSMKIHLTKQNTDNLMDLVLEVADPKSSKYGNHYTRSEVKTMFSASEESSQVVMEWLATYDIPTEDMKVTGPFQNNLEFEIDVATAQDLLDTTFGWCVSSETGTEKMRMQSSYFLPSEIDAHVALITPGFHLPPSKHIRDAKIFAHNSRNKKISKQSVMDDASIEGYTGLTFVDPYVYPDKLQRFYSISSDLTGTSDDNAQCVASFLYEYYNMDDLSTFWSAFQVTEDTMTNVPSFEPSGTGSEAELDVQYITSTGQGIETYVWDTEDDSYFIGLVENILDSEYNISVVSMSYGGVEQEEGEEYCLISSDLFGIASLTGITFFASSGDSGASYDGELVDGYFAPNFPASSTYVTAVGGTTGGNTVTDVDEDTGEEGWYYSGGGFSYYFDQPSWQTTAVEYYLDNVAELPNSDYFDTSKRAFPDISARGNYYVIVVEEEYWSVSGTSCSCPLTAGMFAMMNDMRLEAGYSTFGLLSPLLYSIFDSAEFGELFNDPTEGYNEGVSDDDGVGFYCLAGWDPVTGVGTMKFAKVASLFVEAGASSDTDSDEVVKKVAKK